MKIHNVAPRKQYGWAKYFLKKMKRRNVLVAPRQHGKSTLVSEIVRSFVFMKENPRRPPEYDLNGRKLPYSSRIVMLSDTVERLYKIYSNEFKRLYYYDKLFHWNQESQTSLKVSRDDGVVITINLAGSKTDPTKVTGTPPDLVIVDEAALCNELLVLQSVLPATNKSRGIVIVTGTVSNNWFHDFYLKAKQKMLEGSPNWFAFFFRFRDKWSQTVHDEAGFKEIEDDYDFKNPEDRRLFAKEQMCDWFAGTPGNIFSRKVNEAIDQNRVVNLTAIPNQKLGLTWDNGLGCTAVWFWQYMPRTPRLLKYQEWRGESCHKIAADIKEYAKFLNNEIGCMVIPHTMYQRSQSEKALKNWTQIYCELLEFEGKIINIPKVSNKSLKFDALHLLLQQSFFDEGGCMQGIRHLGSFVPDESRRQQDKHSHAVDSLSELAMAYTNKEIDRIMRDMINLGDKDIFEKPFEPPQTDGSVLGPY